MAIQRPGDIREQVEELLECISEETNVLVNIPHNHLAYPRQAECRDRITKAVDMIDELMDGLEDAAEIYGEITRGKSNEDDPDPLDDAVYFEDMERGEVEGILCDQWFS